MRQNNKKLALVKEMEEHVADVLKEIAWLKDTPEESERDGGDKKTKL